MSHVLTPASSLDSVTVPDPGDARTAASVGTPFQQVLNRTRYLQVQSWGGIDRNVMYPIEGGANDDFVNATGWVYASKGWLQTDISVAPILAIPLQVPPNVTITRVEIRLFNPGAAHSDVPATKPVLTFYEIDPFSNTSPPHVQFSANATDSSASAAAYDANHGIVISPAHLVDTSLYRYLVTLSGEAGANAAINKLQVAGLYLNWTAP